MKGGLEPLHSIVVPVHNGSDFIQLFWGSLLSNLPRRAEVIVIDDGSREDIDRLLPKPRSKAIFKIFRNKSAQGYSKAVNRGLQVAVGEYVYLLNTDLILGQGALELIHTRLNEDESVGIVGAKLLYPQSGKIQHFGLAFTHTRKFHIFTHMEADNPLVCEQTEFQAVTFALCGFRNDLMKRVGCLDPSYSNGCEDIDFSLRVKKAGFRLLIPPDVASYHWESLSGESRHVATLENEARFWGTWAKEIVPDVERFLIRSIRLFFAQRQRLRDRTFTIVNLSSGNDFQHTLNALSACLEGYEQSEFWDYSRPARKEWQLWLAMTLPIDAVRHPKPFLFIVHEYPQLIQNHYWFTARRQFCEDDIIVDQYANVLGATETIFPSVAFRQKGPMDVS
jgi:GT2 family glycosyltransferase